MVCRDTSSVNFNSANCTECLPLTGDVKHSGLQPGRNVFLCSHMTDSFGLLGRCVTLQVPAILFPSGFCFGIQKLTGRSHCVAI